VSYRPRGFIVLTLCAAIGVPEARLECIKKILDMMPALNLVFLIYLVDFLRLVSTHAGENKMTASNLAMVFAPNLLRSRDDSLDTCMADTPHAAKIMESLIDHYAFLFNVRTYRIEVIFG
jgi:hypothetical protein